MSARTFVCKNVFTFSRLPLLAGIGSLGYSVGAIAGAAFFPLVPAAAGIGGAIALGATGYNLLKGELVVRQIDNGDLELAAIEAAKNAALDVKIQFAEMKLETLKRHRKVMNGVENGIFKGRKPTFTTIKVDASNA